MAVFTTIAVSVTAAVIAAAAISASMSLMYARYNNTMIILMRRVSTCVSMCACMMMSEQNEHQHGLTIQ